MMDVNSLFDCRLITTIEVYREKDEKKNHLSYKRFISLVRTFAPAQKKDCII